MTNFRILILILVIGLNSCSEKKNKAELNEVETKKTVDKEKTLSLSIFQKSRDSSYFQRFESKASNKVEFELVNYESDQLVGIMSELRFIQEDIDGKDMLNVIKTEMAVDNKLKTHNIGIG